MTEQKLKLFKPEDFEKGRRFSVKNNDEKEVTIVLPVLQDIADIANEILQSKLGPEVQRWEEVENINDEYPIWFEKADMWCGKPSHRAFLIGIEEIREEK